MKDMQSMCQWKRANNGNSDILTKYEVTMKYNEKYNNMNQYNEVFFCAKDRTH